MKDIGLGSGDVLGIIAPEDDFSVGRKDLFELESPVHLQLSIGLDVLQFHEVLDLGT